MALDQTSVAISAYNSIARMLGHMIERSEKKIDATIEHKVELIEQTKLQVLDLIAEVQQEKAPPHKSSVLPMIESLHKIKECYDGAYIE